MRRSSSFEPYLFRPATCCNGAYVRSDSVQSTAAHCGTSMLFSNTNFGTANTLCHIHDLRLTGDTHVHPKAPTCLGGSGMSNDNSLNHSCSLPSSTRVFAASGKLIRSSSSRQTPVKPTPLLRGLSVQTISMSSHPQW